MHVDHQLGRRIPSYTRFRTRDSARQGAHGTSGKRGMLVRDLEVRDVGNGRVGGWAYVEPECDVAVGWVASAAGLLFVAC